MSAANFKRFVCAFDHERTGSSAASRVIGIGASVVDETFTERYSLLAACYKPKEALFEWDCVEEFYLGSELKELRQRRAGEDPIMPDFTPRDVLDILQAKTPAEASSQDEAERIAVGQFICFLERAEKRAKDEGAAFVLCSNKTISDGHWINKLIEKYRPDLHPLPFSPLTGRWSKFHDVEGIQRGLLTQVQPDFIIAGKKATAAIEAHWNVPKKIKEHNHDPSSDAYTIAFDMQVAIAIGEGRIVRK